MGGSSSSDCEHGANKEEAEEAQFAYTGPTRSKVPLHDHFPSWFNEISLVPPPAPAYGASDKQVHRFKLSQSKMNSEHFSKVASHCGLKCLYSNKELKEAVLSDESDQATKERLFSYGE